LGEPETSADNWRPLADRLYMQNQIFYVQSSQSNGVETSEISIKNQEAMVSQRNFQIFDALSVNKHFLAQPLPKDYQFVSLERLGPDLLIRMKLRNADTDTEFHNFKAEPLQLKGLFTKDLVDEDLHHVIEVSATSNQARVEMENYRQQFPWSASSSKQAPVEWKFGDFVHFRPGQIRSFLVYSNSDKHENGLYDVQRDANSRVKAADRLMYS
jgi:hypothetical protein